MFPDPIGLLMDNTQLGLSSYALAEAHYVKYLLPEIARQERERERQERERERERQERERERQHELQLKKMDHELQLRQLELGGGGFKGVTTEAEFVQELKKQKLISWDKDSWGNLFTFSAVFQTNPTFPDPGAGEKATVQPFVTGMLKKIFQTAVNYAHVAEVYWTDFGAPEKYSFRKRKPDNVIYQMGYTGSLGIVMIGDNKGRSATENISEFSDERVGHILDMARELMEEVQTYRQFMYCFLTDGFHMQFFRVDRTSHGLKYLGSPLYPGIEGWKNLISLLLQRPETLGFQPYTLPNWRLEDVLGRGGQAIVYKAVAITDASNTAVVKAFTNQACRDQEASILQRLNQSGVPNVPRYLQSCNGDRVYFLIYQSVGIPVLPCANGSITTGSHYRQLLDTIRATHAAGIVHRDIKPDNVFVLESDNQSVLLNDWGSAVILSTFDPNTQPWQGTRGYHDRGAAPSKKADLIAVVRTLFVLYRQITPPTNDEQKVTEFWQKHLAAPFWQEMLTAANDENISALDTLLARL